MARSQSLRSIFILLVVSLFIAACGGGGGGGSSDLTPNSFSFSAEDTVEREATVESGTITVSGIDKAVSISITGGEYRINGGAYTSSAGTVSQGQTVEIRLIASDEFATAAISTVTIGGVSGSFTATTLEQDTTPEGLTDFTAKTLQPLNTAIESNSITVSNINDIATVEISQGGEYAIGENSFTTENGEVSNGETIVVRLTSALTFNTPIQVTLTVGGVESVFTASTLLQDTTPEGLADFASQTLRPRDTLILSNAITVSNINDVAAVEITNGGAFSIGGDDFITENGEVSSGETIVVRLTSALTFNTPIQVTLTVGGVESVFTARTLLSDTTPEGLEGVISEVLHERDVYVDLAITVMNINDDAVVNIEGGEYSVGGSGFSALEGAVSPGEEIIVRLRTSATFGETTEATLTVGGVEAEFSATTEDRAVVPTQFVFIDIIEEMTPSTLTESNIITISGINDAAAVQISGGEYQVIGGSGYTSASGTVSNGEQIQVRGLSPTTLAEPTNVLLTIEGLSDTFTLTTLDESAPTVTILFPPENSMTEGNSVLVRGIAQDDYSEIQSLEINGEPVETTDNFATWQLMINLDPEDNTLIAAVSDNENTNDTAAEVRVFQDVTRAAYPPSNSPYAGFVVPILFDPDLNQNRIIFGSIDIDGDSPETFPAIFSLNLSNGERTLISNGTVTDGAVMTAPIKLLPGASTDEILVLDFLDSSIYRVFLSTGDVETISTNVDRSDDVTIVNPVSMIYNPNNQGQLLIINSDNEAESQLLMLDIDSGEAESMVLSYYREDEDFGDISAIGYDEELSKIVLLASAPSTGLYELDGNLIDYIVEPISTNDQYPLFPIQDGEVFTIDGGAYIVSDDNTSTLFRIRAASGSREVLSDSSTPDGVNNIDEDISLETTPLGYYIFSHEVDGLKYEILAVDKETGARVVLSSWERP